jgi:hypothetical protein
MSFLRHGQIYPFDEGAIPQDHALPHRTDEFPAGYSSAGCTPAEPASASPAGSHLAGHRLRCTIEFQRTAGRVLTVCLSSGDHPTVGRHSPPGGPSPEVEQLERELRTVRNDRDPRTTGQMHRGVDRRKRRIPGVDSAGRLTRGALRDASTPDSSANRVQRFARQEGPPAKLRRRNLLVRRVDRHSDVRWTAASERGERHCDHGDASQKEAVVNGKNRGFNWLCLSASLRAP